MTHRYKKICLLLGLGSIALTGCQGGSSGNTTASSPSSSTAKSYAGVEQYATPAANCVVVSGQNLSVGDYWIGGTVTIKNECSDNQLVDQTKVYMTSSTSDLNPSVFAFYNLEASTSLISPMQGWTENWVSTTTSVAQSSNAASGHKDLEITLNLANKAAYLLPGGSTSFSFGYNPAGVSPGDVKFTSKVTPEVPAEPGNINFSLNTKQLSTVCTATTPCNIPVHLEGQNGNFDQVVDTIDNSKANKTLSYELKDLKAGDYHFVVNSKDLPVGVTFSSSGLFSLPAGSTITESAIFSKVKITTGNVTYRIVKPTTFETQYSSVEVNLDRNDGTQSYTDTHNFSADQINNVEKGTYILTTRYGLADAKLGKYANPIKKGSIKVTAESTIDVGDLAYGTRNSNANVTVNVSGLNSNEVTAVTLTDNLDGKSYLYNNISLLDGKNTLKLIESDNVVLNLSTPAGYKAVPPIAYKVEKNGVINVKFEKIDTTPIESEPVNNAYYSSNITKDIYGNPVLGFQIHGISEPVKKVILTSTAAPKVGGFPSCFGVAAGQYSFTTTNDAGSQVYKTVFTPGNSQFNPSANSNCGEFLYQDPQHYAFVMRSQLETAGTSLPDILNPSITGVSIELADGSQVKLSEKNQAIQTEDPGHGKVLQGYYASWSIYNGMNFGPDKIPYTRFNTLNYAFIYFVPNTGEVYAGDYNADGVALPKIAQEIKKYPYMKAILSTGGWTNYKNGAPVMADTLFDTLTASDARINTFATGLVNAMHKLGFQGVNVDWEWWASTPSNQFSADQANKTLKLYRAVRKALDDQGTKDGKHYLFDIAVGAGKDKIDAPERVHPGYWKEVYGLIDNIGLMSYDMHGGWDVGNPAYFQAPWLMDSTNPYKASGYDIVSALTSYEHYIGSSPMKKFVIGVPAYGRALQVASLTNSGLFQTGVADGIGQRTAEMSLWDYKCIINKVVCTQSGQRSHSFTLVNQNSTGNDKALWDKYSKDLSYQPWAYGSAGGVNNLFVTYDDVYSVTRKTQEAKRMGLAGMMLWEVDGDADDDVNSLFKAMSNELAK